MKVSMRLESVNVKVHAITVQLTLKVNNITGHSFFCIVKIVIFMCWQYCLLKYHLLCLLISVRLILPSYFIKGLRKAIFVRYFRQKNKKGIATHVKHGNC